MFLSFFTFLPATYYFACYFLQNEEEEMPRAKGGFKTRRRRKKILERAKGYYGAKSRLFRVATETVDKALQYAYRDRKAKKREFRALWITRISAAVRAMGPELQPVHVRIKEGKYRTRQEGPCQISRITIQRPSVR